MSKKQIHIGVEDSQQGFKRFINAWHQAQSTKAAVDVEYHLNFEDFTQFAAVLTPKRIELLRVLKQEAPMSIRALSKLLERDYKNVHTDVSELIEVDLIQQDDEDLLFAPFDVIDAHVRLVA